MLAVQSERAARRADKLPRLDLRELQSRRGSPEGLRIRGLDEESCQGFSLRHVWQGQATRSEPRPPEEPAMANNEDH